MKMVLYTCKPFAQPNYTEAENDIITARDQPPPPHNNNVTPSIALLQLKQKLADAPHDDKSYLVYAQQTTDLITDDHLMGFLHVENFDIDVSIYQIDTIYIIFISVNSFS